MGNKNFKLNIDLLSFSITSTNNNSLMAAIMLILVLIVADLGISGVCLSIFSHFSMQ